MQKSAEGIPNNVDWLVGVIIVAIIIVIGGAIWGFTQEPPSLRDVIDTGGILVALLGLVYSHYQANRRYEQSEHQIEEMRRTRLQPEYKERSQIIDEAIERAQDNINLLYDGGFEGDFDRVLELESLSANHQKYFEEEHPEFVKKLREFTTHERELNRLQSQTKFNLEESSFVDDFINKHSKSDAHPRDWLIEQIITFSTPDMDEIEEELGITNFSDKVPVQNGISDTQRGHAGIFPYDPPPKWMQEYVEAKDSADEYFRSQREELKQIKRSQTV